MRRVDPLADKTEGRNTTVREGAKKESVKWRTKSNFNSRPVSRPPAITRRQASRCPRRHRSRLATANTLASLTRRTSRSNATRKKRVAFERLVLRVKLARVFAVANLDR